MQENQQKVQYVFLDSGVGGLPYLKYLLEKEKDASCLYVADTKHFPYGEKEKGEIIEYSKALVDEIIKKTHPSIIIVACNTMTVTALKVLRESFSCTFVGTVPAIKVAKEKTKNGRVALIGTERTIKEEYTQNLISNFLPDAYLYMSAESELVKKIEEGLFLKSEEEQIKAIYSIFDRVKENLCDSLILGCTHFLHLRGAFIKIAKQCSPRINIADSLEGVVNQALRLSQVNKHLNAKKAFYATGISNEEDKRRYEVYAKFYSLEFIEDLNVF